MIKKELVEGLKELYDNNKLNEKEECTILNTLEYLGFNIKEL